MIAFKNKVLNPFAVSLLVHSTDLAQVQDFMSLIYPVKNNLLNIERLFPFAGYAI
jgi:hypothetical protein